LESATIALKIIPNWSPHSQQAGKLSASLWGESEKINQITKGLQAASLAQQQAQTPSKSLDELQKRQQLWRIAIAPLENIKPGSEFYPLAQAQLPSYRRSLQVLNQQLFAEEKWLKKITAAKAVASSATQREATAKSLQDLQKAQSTWQVAVNALNAVPRNSQGYEEAQVLLQEYKPKLAVVQQRAAQEQLAAKAYQQALNAANQAKNYEILNQWSTSVAYWQQALSAAKQVPADSPYSSQVQSLIDPYAIALQRATEKSQSATSLQQTRTDLVKTCTSGLRICNFTIDSKGITVRITPEYEKTIQNAVTNANPLDPSSFATVNSHLRTLQEALGVISDNANLPLVVYDGLGQEIQRRTPGV
jgi:hypothetical protein